MAIDTLTLYVPFELDPRGRCCQSRIVVARGYEIARVDRYFEKQLKEAHRPYGLVVVHYEWQGSHYTCVRSDAVVTGPDEGDEDVMAQFEAFPDTIHYYPRLDRNGLPLPGDEPNLHYPDPEPWLRGGRHLPSARQRHRREPRLKKSKVSTVTFGQPVKLSDYRAGKSTRLGSRLRLEKSTTHQPSPLYPSRSKPQIAYPPRGCHPFVKTRAASELALKKLPASIRSKGFHSYELCEFGDITSATSRANFLALKRRKGTVIGFYNFYREPFAIVTDMKDRVAMLLLRTEL